MAASPSGISAVSALLDSAGVPYSIPESANFNELLSNYSGNHQDKKPGIIASPESHQHVEAVVSACVANKAQIVVRGGGHDIFGRSTVADAVVIDLRKLNSVTVSEGRGTAHVGGGATANQVLEALASEKLQVPVGSCGTVGYVGWCIVGGFGPYIHSYGLGADQIVGAKVVNAEGKLVDADEKMLKGLRGGGANLGVVVELTVKAYPLQDVQAGMLMFDSSDLSTAVTTFFTNYQKLFDSTKKIPSQLYAMPFIFAVPAVGITLCCCIVWNGTATDESRAWIEDIGKLAPLVPGMPEPQVSIATMRALDFSQHLTAMLPPQILGGRPQSASLTRLSPGAISSLANVAAKMPKSSNGGINMHIIREDCPSCLDDVPDSVCPYREPHIMLELLGVGPDEETGKEAAEWSMAARNELMGLEEATKKVYIAVTSPECSDWEDVFGDKLEQLRELKKEYDPNGVFKNAIPRLID
ncbi:hypothetical protein B0J13DRAFT_678855 [Dactylonectria estremocensis]|uniref:FAD-binding PCMH-type domain-containing protein n=1 Tax=Dactylonectria estremocensis TaxID=1079267 RepID=A0A9P9E338_9HYPO|nr:hypothetical protein B0J13DRAFT_678855 [Dactylonectria estremocensis]